MIETIAIPILMKAVDFLFDEGHKIFQERRERRKKELEEDEPVKAQDKSVDSRDSGSTESVIQSKDAALNISIDEANWNNSEGKVKHLMDLLEIYTKNYYLAKEQHAKWGSALAPPIVVHNLEEAENQVADTTKELQEVLSEVYAKPVDIL